MSSIPCKLAAAIKNEILPLARDISALPAVTLFVFTDQDTLDNIVMDIMRESPLTMRNKSFFVDEMQLAFDRHSCRLNTDVLK
jgi:hypothetical protein